MITESTPMRVKSAQARPLRFGFSFPTSTQTMGFLSDNPTWGLVTKDVVGLNFPRLLVTRTWKETRDLATCELGNSSITLFSTMAVPLLLRHVMQVVSGIKPAALTGNLAEHAAARIKTARLGVAFGFMFPFAAAFWALPFLRNYLTLKREGTSSFETLIGLKKGAPTSPVQARDIETKKRFQLHRAIGVMATGLALGAISLVTLGLLARGKGLKLSALGKYLSHHFDLQGEGANQVASGRATFIFWLAPAYLGWLHAARGKNEFKEFALKFANSTFWFCVFPGLVKKVFANNFHNALQNGGIVSKFGTIPSYKELVKLLTDCKLTKPTYDGLIKLKNRQFLAEFSFTLLMLGIVPQIANILLTKHRVAHQAPKAASSVALPQSELYQPQPALQPLFNTNFMPHPAFVGNIQPIWYNPTAYPPMQRNPWATVPQQAS